MSTVHKITGTLAATGAVVYDGPSNASEPAAIYDHLLIEGDGHDWHLQRVIVPAYLDSFLTVGAAMTLYVAVVQIPTLLGSKPMYVVYALATGGKVRTAVAEAKRCFGRSKIGGALKLFGYGFLLLIVYGVGVLFWAQGARLLMTGLPDDMKEPA